MQEKTPEFNLDDTVILSPAYGNEAVAKIVKVTKTRAFISEGNWFDRHTGREPGKGPWRRAYIYHATPEKIASIAQRNKKYTLVNYLNKSNWELMSIEQLERIVSITKENEVKK